MSNTNADANAEADARQVPQGALTLWLWRSITADINHPNILMNHNLKIAFLIIITTSLSFLCPPTSDAQFGAEWSVAQAYGESGILHYDFDGDGHIDLSKQLLNTLTVYSGADSFNVIWSLTVPNRDQALVWNEYPFGANRRNIVLMFANTYGDSTLTDLVAYSPLGNQPLWRTPQRPGYQSFLDTANVDDDAATEIVYGLNLWANNAYRSRFYVIGSTNGALEYRSDEFTGYMYGPFVGDLDGDGVVEVLVNIYSIADSSANLSVFSFHPNGVRGDLTAVPRQLTVGAAFPNPFNSSTLIPYEVRTPSEVSLRVFDVSGRTIRFLNQGMLPVGQHQVGWDGLDSRGMPAPAGSYFCEVKVGADRSIKPLRLVR